MDTLHRVRRPRLFFLSVYFFGLSFLWNGLSLVILPMLVATLVPEAWKNAYLGLLSSAGLALAALVQPLSGHLSDRTATPWGRRRPWILAGTLGDFVCLALLATAGGFPALAVGYLLLQVSSNVAHGPAFGLIPDLVPPGRRGAASGAKGLAEIAGLIAGGLVAGHLAGQGRPGAGLAAIGLVLAAALAGTLWGVREEPVPLSSRNGPRRRPLLDLQGALDGLREAQARHSAYLWLLAARLLMLTAITPVQGFAQYYVQDVLRVPNPAAATGQLAAAIGLSVLIAAYPAGILADRWGAWPLNVASGLLAGFGIAGMVLAQTLGQVLALASAVGLAMGVFVSANWALATRLAPEEAGGRYLGLSNLATAGAGMLGRLAGPMIDAVNLVRPNAGYLALFATCSLLMWMGTALLFQVRRGSVPT